MSTSLYYGLTSFSDIKNAAKVICDTLGHGVNNVAVRFLCEIAAQETLSGYARDRHTIRLGVGLMQIDRIAYIDVQERTSGKTWNIIYDNHGINGETLNYEMLAYSPLLSILFARLFLRLIPKEFPVSRKGRAKYWKKYYNTEAGAGTVEQYLNNTANIGRCR